MGVTYLPVAGAPGYRVGADGSAWSWHATGRPGRPAGWFRLKAAVASRRGRRPGLGGALAVLLYGRPRAVADLVLRAFRGPPPRPGAQPVHLDRDPKNCALCNLRWTETGRD